MARNKVTVIGAGNVGATTAQRIAEAGLADVVLVDIVEGLPQGKGLDLAEAAPVVGHDARITGTNDYADTAGSDVIVVTSGPGAPAGHEPRRPAGQERRHRQGGRGGRGVAVAGRRADRRHEPARRDVPRGDAGLRVSRGSACSAWPASSIRRGSGRSSPRSSGVSVEDTHAFVLGGHGDTMVPLPRYSTVAGIPITELLSADRIAALVDRTANGGAEVVALLKTGSAFYAPAASTFEMVDAILRDRRRVLPCAVLLQGEYGVDGLFVGVPVVLGAGGLQRVIEITLTADEQAAFERVGRRRPGARRQASRLSAAIGPQSPPTRLARVPLGVITLAFDPVVELSDTSSVRVETIALGDRPVPRARCSPRGWPASPRRSGRTCRRPGLRFDDLVFILVGAVPGAIAGGRLGYVLDHLAYYKANPAAILDPAQGGLTLTLAVPLGILTGGFIARLLGAPVGRWLHAAAFPLLFVLAAGKLIGVLGATGQGAPSDLPWATAYAGPGPWGSLAAEIAVAPGAGLRGDPGRPGDRGAGRASDGSRSSRGAMAPRCSRPSGSGRSPDSSSPSRGGTRPCSGRCAWSSCSTSGSSRSPASACSSARGRRSRRRSSHASTSELASPEGRPRGHRRRCVGAPPETLQPRGADRGPADLELDWSAPAPGGRLTVLVGRRYGPRRTRRCRRENDAPRANCGLQGARGCREERPKEPHRSRVHASSATDREEHGEGSTTTEPGWAAGRCALACARARLSGQRWSKAGRRRPSRSIPRSSRS